MPLTGEPAVIVGAIVAALTAIQAAAISMSTTAHTLIAVAIVALGTLITRSQVTPKQLAASSSDDRLSAEAKAQIPS